MAGYDYLFKLVVCGDAGVGKSSILLRLVDDTFVDSYFSTYGVEFQVKTIESDRKTAKLQIWDTAGQERFRDIISSYYSGAHGIILVYSIDSRESFENVRHWFREIEKYADDGVNKILISNKTDLSSSSRAVSSEEGQSLADSYSVPFLEVSAKTSSNISEAFYDLTSDIQDKINPGPKFAITLAATRTGNCTSITCFSVAGEELGTVAIDDDSSMTWAKLRPMLLDALDRKGQRINFISSSGSMLSLSDNSKLVTEILELPSVGKADHSGNIVRITSLFQGCGVEVGQQELASILHTVSGKSTHLVETEVKVLFEAFARERGMKADTVLARDFLPWLFEALK